MRLIADTGGQPSVGEAIAELRRILQKPSGGSEWLRAARLVGLAALACAVAFPFLPPGARAADGSLALAFAPVAAAAACASARARAEAGGRTTWLLFAVGAALAAAGQVFSARASMLPDRMVHFPSSAFVLFLAFHVLFAEGAILALRPARDPRLALEIGLDGLLVLLAAGGMTLRFVLDPPVIQGWLSLGDAVTMLVGQLAVAGSLLFVALLVLWRDTELSGAAVDTLFISALLFTFGNVLITLGLDPIPGSTGDVFDVMRFAGWAALAVAGTLGAAWPVPSHVTERRAQAARLFRQLTIPAAALFLTAAAIDVGTSGHFTREEAVLVGAMGLVLAARIGSALYAVQHEAEERRRAEAQANESRIRAITAQMNPHFLFNALHSLSALVRRDPAGSERALEQLGGLLRYGLDRGDHLVTLADEWRFARDYVGIEELRLGPRLTVIERFDPASLDCLVPPFVLQPLVENAIRYGVSPFPRGGEVEVGARIDGDVLHVHVRDTGPGATPARIAGATGVGLRGVRAQLARHFGGDAVMSTEQFSGGGFIVRLALPVDAD